MFITHPIRPMHQCWLKKAKQGSMVCIHPALIRIMREERCSLHTRLLIRSGSSRLVSSPVLQKIQVPGMKKALDHMARLVQEGLQHLIRRSDGWVSCTEALAL